DGLHHALEDRIEHCPGFLRISVRQQLHGAFEIGEKDRHLLAFYFGGETGGEDLVVEKHTALAAELLLGRVLMAARETNHPRPSRDSSGPIVGHVSRDCCAPLAALAFLWGVSSPPAYDSPNMPNSWGGGE